MPHFDEHGNDTWLCQKCTRTFPATPTTMPTWVQRDTDLAKKLGCTGNVCSQCLERLDHFPDGLTHGQAPIGIVEHCRRESGLEGRALQDYINHHYGHS